MKFVGGVVFNQRPQNAVSLPQSTLMGSSSSNLSSLEPAEHALVEVPLVSPVGNTDAIVEERDTVVQQLEPQQRKRKRQKLTQEEKLLKKTQTSREDKNFIKWYLEVGILEKQFGSHQQEWAASVIQLHYYRHRLKKIMRDELLHKEEELLLTKKQEIEKACATQQTAFSEKLAELTQKQQWVDIAKGSQLAEAAKQEYLSALKNLEDPLKELKKRKTAKREQMIKNTVRFSQIVERNEKSNKAMKDIMQSQQQAIIQLGAYTSKRGKEMFKFFSLNEVVPQAEQEDIVKPFSSCSLSSSFPQAIIPLSVLKPADNLSVAQIELQNQLTQACYCADVAKVKELIKKKGADPAIPDKVGQQPLAAAIWGLAFKVMDYLEKTVKYTGEDWQTIAKDLQQRHRKLLPASTKIVTYGDWFEHYNSREAAWFYHYSDCKVREYEDIPITWDGSRHIASMSYALRFRNVHGVTQYNTAGSQQNWCAMSERLKSGSDGAQPVWFSTMVESMANRLGKHGIKCNSNYQQEEVKSSDGLSLPKA